MGLAHYADMGSAARVIDLKAAEDAEREELAAAVAGASMVFFSGGKPQHLASVVRGTRFEAAVRTALDSGPVYAGCSAGAMVASRAPDLRGTKAGFGSAWLFGLGLVPNVSFGVHWDKTRYIPGLRAFVTSRMPEGAWFVGIDERTAILGDGTSWEVHGLGSVAVMGAEDRATYRAGDRFRTPSV